MKYWNEVISQSLDDLGIKLTDAQIDSIAADVECSHENYSMYSGSDVADANLAATNKRERDELEAKLRTERDKIICREYNGHGWITSIGPCHSSTSSCWKCKGDGRHSP